MRLPDKCHWIEPRMEIESETQSMADALGDYLETVSRIPLLTPAEEVHLAQRVQRWQQNPAPTANLERTGRRAMNRMVQANLRLVVSIARKYQSATVERMDLIQAGNIGLMRAVEKFDPTRGYRFSTYAFWWIRQAITRHLREQGSAIRLPTELIDLAARVSQLQNASPVPLSMAKLAELVGETEERLKHVLAIRERSQALSLDRITESMDGSRTLLDSVPSTDEPDCLDDYQWLHSQVSGLDSRERTVLKLRYGKLDSLSFVRVAQCTGLSRDQVQRIERGALKKLRARLTPVLFP